MIGRRKFLIGSLATIIAGCGPPYYVGDGVPIATPTDGELLDTCADYFRSSESDCYLVESYTPELADLLNETWLKEFSIGIDRHIYLLYVDETPLGRHGEYDVIEEPKFRRMRYREERQKQVYAEKGAEPCYALCILAHELGHQFSLEENVPMLTGYRISTMADVHFPQFAIDSNFMNFTIAHGDMLRMIDWNELQYKYAHNIGTLEALLALNETNGSFAQAHQALLHNRNYFVQKANDFVNYYTSVNDVVGVTAVHPQVGAHPETLLLRELARKDLWNIVAYQVIKNNIELNPGIDALIKPALLQGFKNAAQFQQTSTFAETELGGIPSINPKQTNHYSDALLGSLPYIIVPPEYCNNTPKGL